jgi:hypothetical protein
MKRKWFQIHLSTAIVMSILSGGLVWANLTLMIDSLSPMQYDWNCHFSYGFPFGAVTRNGRLIKITDSIAAGHSPEEFTVAATEWVHQGGRTQSLIFMRGVGWLAYDTSVEADWHLSGTILNILTAILVLCLTGVSLEYLIRRREARKP